MDKKPIHMVKAAFHGQFKKAMESCGLAANDYFRDMGLPTEVSDPQGLLPEKPFWRLINSIALRENMPDFGMRVAQTMPWHRIDSLAPLLSECISLESLLQTFSRLASSQASNVAFELQRTQSAYWFNYFGDPVIKGDVQMELYRITSMIEMVQQATGPDWSPRQVRLLMPESRVARACPMLRHSEISFSNTASGLAIEAQLIALPVEFDGPALPAGREVDHTDIPSDFEISIRKIIDSYSPNGEMSIDDLASLNDMTVRTLQRRLAAHNLNFKQMLNQAQFSHASEKLKNTGLSIAEIASSMGYSDPAHFTRAFRRWSGVTPSSFRKRQMNR